MHETAFDTLARHASSATDRRASLKALGAAAMVAALAAPGAADAKQSAGKKAKKKCAKQVGPCQAEVKAGCEGNETCLQLLDCCDSLKTCNSRGFVSCLMNIL